MPPYLAVLVILYLIVDGKARSEKSQAPARRVPKNSAIDGELTLRFFFLTFFLCTEFLTLFVLGAFALLKATLSIKPEWLMNIVISGAAIPALFILVWSYPWLAWRLCRPLGLFFFARRFYWFTPGATRRDLQDFEALLRASRGVPPAPPPQRKNGSRGKILKFSAKRPLPFLVDAKTTLTLALAREVLGDYARTERLLRTFELCPPGLKALGRFRLFAFEELAWHAAKRGDWNAVLRRARMGSGRGMLLMRLLAEKHSGRRVHWSALWFALLISPSRRRAVRLVFNTEKLVPSEIAQWSSSREGLRSTHISLLSKASEGISIDLGDVFRLARSWDHEFSVRKKDNLLRRGMELGARDVFGLAKRIEENVLDELAEMAAAAEGEIPPEVLAGINKDGTSYAGRLFFRLRTRLYSDIDALLSLFRVESDEKVEEGHLLELWENWLSLCESVSRFHRLMGMDELSALWYGTLRNAVWNSISSIFNDHRGRVAFISMIIFNWVAQVSQSVGDDEGLAVNRNNTRICRDELFVKPSVLKQISKWAA